MKRATAEFGAADSGADLCHLFDLANELFQFPDSDPIQIMRGRGVHSPGGLVEGVIGNKSAKMIVFRSLTLPICSMDFALDLLCARAFSITEAWCFREQDGSYQARGMNISRKTRLCTTSIWMNLRNNAPCAATSHAFLSHALSEDFVVNEIINLRLELEAIVDEIRRQKS